MDEVEKQDNWQKEYNPFSNFCLNSKFKLSLGLIGNHQIKCRQVNSQKNNRKSFSNKRRNNEINDFFVSANNGKQLHC